jgi:hypothetical protein
MAREFPKNAGEAIGRSRGGLTTQIQAIVDAFGNPLAVAGGQVHDVTQWNNHSRKMRPRDVEQPTGCR